MSGSLNPQKNNNKTEQKDSAKKANRQTIAVLRDFGWDPIRFSKEFNFQNYRAYIIQLLQSLNLIG